MLKYEITLTWRGETALFGNCAASCGIETARNFIERNFVGLEVRRYIATFELSRPLDRLLKTGRVELAFGDETGSCRATIARIES